MKITLENDKGQTREFILNMGNRDNLNVFIVQALLISEDKRELPFRIVSPSGDEVYPSLKMKFKNYGSPLLDDALEAMHVTWRGYF